MSHGVGSQCSMYDNEITLYGTNLLSRYIANTSDRHLASGEHLGCLLVQVRRYKERCTWLQSLIYPFLPYLRRAVCMKLVNCVIGLGEFCVVKALPSTNYL
jgi:hypothetical protein